MADGTDFSVPFLYFLTLMSAAGNMTERPTRAAVVKTKSSDFYRCFYNESGYYSASSSAGVSSETSSPPPLIIRSIMLVFSVAGSS